MSIKYISPQTKTQQGVGLIEILITVVLLSIGFLAAAQMQIQGMRFSQSAYFQSQAYFLTSDMIDRMRANLDGIEAGYYDNLVTSASLSSPGCEDSACSPNQLAQQDLFDWSAKLYSMQGDSNFVPTLPSSDPVSATGTITPLGDNIYQVRMTWSEIIDGVETPGFVQMNFAPELNVL
ncbi:MAG: type IV pilus modification protein PilV [Granulosicoccaceae bacterium]